ncbi:MAG: QueT transporter family protein [Thermoplasmata archaeon]|nr:QueT transporter family protein [Thermoplasmata archaeon]
MTIWRIWGLVLYIALQVILVVVAYYVKRYYKRKEVVSSKETTTEEEVFEVRTKRTLARDVTVMGMAAALYVALTAALGPISFGIAGLNFSLATPIFPVVAILYDPISASVAALIGCFFADVAVGWLAPWTVTTMVVHFISYWVIGNIVREPRKLQILIPTLAAQYLAQALYVAWVLDLSGVVAFPLMFTSVIIGLVPWVFLGIPLIVNLMARRGISFRRPLALG